jgi:hypothetical protein
MAPRSPLHRPDRQTEDAQREVITLHTKSGDQTFDALVLSKRADRIQIMLHEGAHSAFCELKPTADALAYVGTSLGREIFYEHSRAEVEADIAKRGSPDSDSPSG